MNTSGLVKTKFLALCIFGMMIFLLASCGSIDDEYPQPTAVIETQFPEDSPDIQSTAIPMPEKSVMYERRLISLEWPQQIKVGESDRIQLILEVDEEGFITPTAMVDGNNLEFESVLIPDLYENYYLNVESRLDIVGMDVLPQGVVSTALIKGKNLVFAWSLSPRQAGSFSGTVWLYLNLIPKNGDPIQKELLLAKPINIKGVTVFGLPATTARWAGFIGTGASFILGLPFIENFILWLFRRLKKTSIIKTNHL